MFIVRPANRDDLGAATAIYNHYVRTTPATFDVEPVAESKFAHYADSGRHRLFVAVEHDDVLGFAGSGPYRAKAAYDTSVETSVYVRHDSSGRGIGRALYTALFGALAGEDVHRAYAGITQPNTASVALHEAFGFRRVAYFTEQGRKFDRYWDVAWYEKQL